MKNLPPSYSRSMSNLKIVNDIGLRNELNKIIELYQHELKGEYEPYTIYQKETGEIYALIHAFYSEKTGILYENINKVAKKDAKFMHEKIRQLQLDYLFVLPYYDHL